MVAGRQKRCRALDVDGDSPPPLRIRKGDFPSHSLESFGAAEIHHPLTLVRVSLRVERHVSRRPRREVTRPNHVRVGWHLRTTTLLQGSPLRDNVMRPLQESVARYGKAVTAKPARKRASRDRVHATCLATGGDCPALRATNIPRQALAAAMMSAPALPWPGTRAHTAHAR